MFKTYYCLVCRKKIKWFQKVGYDEKITRVVDDKGFITPHRHIEATHYDCLTAAQKEELKRKKKKKYGSNDNDTSNVDKITVE